MHFIIGVSDATVNSISFLSSGTDLKITQSAFHNRPSINVGEHFSTILGALSAHAIRESRDSLTAPLESPEATQAMRSVHLHGICRSHPRVSNQIIAGNSP